MTGFARVRESIGPVEATLSVKSVNHRGLDLHFYMPSEMDPFENSMRTAVKRAVNRGHVDIRVQLATSGSGPLGVDPVRLDAYINTFRAAAAKYGLNHEPDLNIAFRLQGMLTDSSVPELPPGFEAPLLQLLDRALEALNQFRLREGSELAAVMIERNNVIKHTAERLAGIRKDVMPAFQSRLRERLGDLLANTVEPQRLLQEAAILADRSDIGEEIARLKIHAAQIEELLSKGSEVGKKLDFLLQEMNRETNTILSKTAGVGETGLTVTELALGVKSEIEKIREQSLNLE